MSYIKGDTIKVLREKKNLTQKGLANQLNVSDKTISKWETGKGYPDIGIIENLAMELDVSITELFTGDLKKNNNQSANISKMHFYVCPVCNNIITSVGQGSFSCCGITLPELDAEESNSRHHIEIKNQDDEYYVTVNHPMDKSHYISFIAYVTTGSYEFVKLYPQQDAMAIFKRKGHGVIYAYCINDGLFKINV